MMHDAAPRVAVACSDKFRGTLTATEATEAIARGLRASGFEEVRTVPLADGGEGTLDVLLAARGGSRRTARVSGPLGDPVDAAWGLLPDGTAVIEMAQASGLALTGGRNDALRASTRGTGELIEAAALSGARRFLVAAGGSATTDGGIGALEALRWSLGGREMVVACDVTTPFLDAARVYGPQKGATAAQVALLSRRLEQLEQEYRVRTGVDVTRMDGAGAAGGLGGGLAAIGAKLRPGFEIVAEELGFADVLADAAVVVTGEGRFDATSFEGKVVGCVLAWAENEGVPHLCVIAGQVAPGIVDELPQKVGEGVLVLALTDRVWQSGEAFTRAPLLVEESAAEAGRWALGTVA